MVQQGWSWSLAFVRAIPIGVVVCVPPVTHMIRRHA